MSKTVVVSFATEDFEPFRRQMEYSAINFNLTIFHSYTKSDLQETEFYKKNLHTFSFNRGYGLWLWKPFFILKSLNKINYGDILFYVDSGCKFINNPSELISLARNNKSGIVSFDCYPITNKQFVKNTTFVNMSCNNEFYWNSNHVIATVILFRKSGQTISFVEEWLKECENLNSLLPEEKEYSDHNLPEFIAHREDQSIFSLLIHKYKIETYRNPSKWGNFLKLKKYREKNELVCYPYGLNNSIRNYSEQQYLNSRYSTIFEFNLKIQLYQISKNNIFYLIIKQCMKLLKKNCI
jgi:hypothetical protein